MGLKNHKIAHLWNFWCLLLTPSWGWVLKGKTFGQPVMAYRSVPFVVET